MIAPPVPGGFTAPAATKVKPTLTFTAAGDTGGSGTDHYNVYRDGALLGVALTTSYTETRRRTRRRLRVHRERGRQGRNEGPQTTPKVVVYDTTAPVAPATPTTSAPVTKVKPAISWTRTTDPGGSGVASYAVYRDGVQIAAAAVGTSYQDTALSANGTYAYAIRANDAAGNASALTADGLGHLRHGRAAGARRLTGPTPTGVEPGADVDVGRARHAVGVRPLRDPAPAPRSAPAPATPSRTPARQSGIERLHRQGGRPAGNVSAASAAKTIVYDTTPPGTADNLAGASPTNLPALSWTAPTDVSGINHYEVFRDGVSSGRRR